MMVFEFVIVDPCKHFNNNCFHVMFAMVFRARNQCSSAIHSIYCLMQNANGHSSRQISNINYYIINNGPTEYS